MSDWRGIESKLKAAVGPNVALDREIAEAAGMNVQFDTFHEKPMVGIKTEWGSTLWRDIPAYTSSLDAALSLLPKDSAWFLQKYDKMDGVEAGVDYNRNERGLYCERNSGMAPTAALALCLAVARAHRHLADIKAASGA